MIGWLSIYYWCLLTIALLTGVTSEVSNKNTDRTVVILDGSELVLNCTTPNGTWWFQGKQLVQYSTRLEGHVTQLRITNVSKEAEGIYWCGLSWQQGYNFSVAVVDKPYPPQNIWKTVMDRDAFIHWTPSLSTGGLPVVYQVWQQCLFTSSNRMDNCSSEDDGSQLSRHCKDVQHVPGQTEYSCQLRLVVLNNYSIFVVAKNDVGATRSKVVYVEKPSSTLQMNPGPPNDLKATEQEPGDVLLTWKQRVLWTTYSMKYMIIYYKEESAHKNKTWFGNGPSSARIDSLDADSTYHFFIRAKICSYSQCSVWGYQASVTHHTKSTAPSKPPGNLNCSLWVANGNKRNVNITWKPPAKENQNGALTHFNLRWYYKGENVTKHLMSINASRHYAVLVNVTNDKSIVSEMTACNAVGCSGVSEQCPTPRLPEVRTTNPNDNSVAMIVGSVCGVVFIVILVVVAILIYRRRNQPPQPQRLPDFDVPVPYTDQYNQVEHIEINEEYDIPVDA